VQHLPETGFLRIRQIVGDPKANPPIPPIIPVSRSAFWAGVRQGRYPQPTRALGPRITAWTVQSIRDLIDRSAPTAANDEQQHDASLSAHQHGTRGRRHGHV
jgi:predicted DNA-binding transcriptional regulator AlpA